ncbi:MAG TPA: protein kinase [Ktedonobacterales bacterium]|nr:protein kinase [Ktedonobacterales bacterium]
METKKRCANCGTALAPGARFCSNCGEAQGDLRPLADTGLLPANQRLNGDRYLIVRKLAQGGQSAVYLAMDTADGQRRAIKEMSESQISPQQRTIAVNDFLREASILMRLSHPGLCRVFNTFIEGHKPFLVMEYVEGHNLEDELIGLGRPLHWQDVTRWGIALSDVLAYLHSQDPPVIYRDLKPANVMLTPQGALKLIDFGIARQLFPQRLMDTARLGTDGYAPLEQYNGRSEPRSDLYALGASLYHLLTGRVPEAAPLRYSGQMLTPIRTLNATVPEPVDRVIQQALRLNVQERFPTAAAMWQALNWAYQVSGGAPVAPASTAGAGGRTSAAAPYGSAAPQSGGAGMPRVTMAPARNSVPNLRPSSPPHSAPPGATNPPADGRRSAPNMGAPGVPGSSGPHQAVRPSFPPEPRDGSAPWSSRMGGDARGVSATPPRLRVWPLRLDVGLLEQRQASSHVLEVANRGGGELNGVVETNSAAIGVSPAKFRGDGAQIQVQVDTTGLQPGEYRLLVAVRSNGGDQIVPVSFMVRPGDGAQAAYRPSGQP